MYHDALRKHERELGKNVVKQWRKDLREVARTKGWNLRDLGLDKLVGLVLEEVFSKLRTRQLNVRNDLVGIHDPMEAIKELFGQATSGVRFVVIYGMGGVGKTTLAKAIFEQMSPQFQSCSFLSDIRQSSRDDGILNLQKKLLCDILGLRFIMLFDAYDGINHIKERLCEKKVLIVLDDMDDREQLKKLAGESSWFGPGSRIIITTRTIPFLASDDESPDEMIPAHPRDFYFYEMKEMQQNHALQLFSKHAFESDSPPFDYRDISSEVVEVTGKLPLTLEVVGSYLYGKNMVIWKDTLKKLKKVPHDDVLKKLMVSYEELEDDQQQIFLDIACYFIGEEKVNATYMWKACDFYPKSGVLVLIQLSLIKIVDGDKLWMHDQLRDLGREIVRQECLQDPGKRSRLWCPTTAFDVVRSRGGMENVVALKLPGLLVVHYFPEHHFTSEEFSRLPNLRFLELDGGNLVGDFTSLLSKLTWLCWHRCPPYLYATNLCLRSLVVLKLSKSDVTEDWLGWGPCMGIGKLKVVHLSSCNRMTKTPDFSSCLNLKRLIFEKCEHLAHVDGSINKLEHLKHLEITATLILGPWAEYMISSLFFLLVYLSQ
ncbi:hypothetical protein NL676_026744 [Syzygium grande]|nr:hypothetical protein NL676_026744 [Syzygium grande]